MNSLNTLLQKNEETIAKYKREALVIKNEIAKYEVRSKTHLTLRAIHLAGVFQKLDQKRSLIEFKRLMLC